MLLICFVVFQENQQGELRRQNSGVPSQLKGSLKPVSCCILRNVFHLILNEVLAAAASGAGKPKHSKKHSIG